MLTETVKRDTKVKRVLVSQPEPENGKSPYIDIAKKYKIKVDFRPFIKVVGIEGREFRKSRINLHDYQSIILTSRNAIDHLFRICDELRVTLSQETKYLCPSEAIAVYLQKYTQYRKRRVFRGDGTFEGFKKVLLKHKIAGENILYPCSEVHNNELPDFLDEHGFNYTKAVIYKTVSEDLSDLKDLSYDVILFFSPLGVKSLFDNFPDFEQGNIRIGACGRNTAKAARDARLIVDIEAPTENVPSMTMALEQYIQQVNK